MMVDCGLISRLPVEWHSLFKQLGSSVERGNVWFTEETSSLYGSQPTWHELLASLTKRDPTIEDDKLKFKPRFLLLPAMLQENLLKFLLHQSFSIPDVYIKQFVLGVIGYMGINTNIYQQITLLIRETKFSDELLMNAIKKCPPELGDTLQGECAGVATIDQ